MVKKSTVLQRLRWAIIAVAALFAGFHFTLAPQTVNPLVIRVVGVLWFVEAFRYGIKVYAHYAEAKVLKKIQQEVEEENQLKDSQ